MISEKEYEEAKLIIKLYESQQFGKYETTVGHVYKPPPVPPPSQIIREGENPVKPKIN